ncbi:MAG: twin-arginine translocase subunit TatC [Bacteroidota bacterium]|nr:twin-arginine translocase subunit TatC [Bacteroidota bacterium]
MADKEKNEEAEMTLMDHLNELRGVLFKAAFAIAGATVVCFIYSRYIFDYVIFAPKSSNFISYRVLCKLSMLFHTKALCFGNFNYSIQNLQMSGQFMTDMSVSFYAGLIITFPYVLYQVWKFIRPALHEKEKKYSRGAVAIMSFLFLTGLLFGYFLIVPLSLNFLGNYKVSGTVVNQWQLNSYISTVTTISLGMGAVFEIPVLIFFLSKIGILSPAFMRRTRKYAFLIILILASIIAPPDVLSLFMVTVPLYLLYEVGIFFSARAAKKEEEQKNSSLG